MAWVELNDNGCSNNPQSLNAISTKIWYRLYYAADNACDSSFLLSFPHSVLESSFCPELIATICFLFIIRTETIAPQP